MGEVGDDVGMVVRVRFRTRVRVRVRAGVWWRRCQVLVSQWRPVSQLEHRLMGDSHFHPIRGTVIPPNH